MAGVTELQDDEILSKAAIEQLDALKSPKQRWFALAYAMPNSSTRGEGKNSALAAGYSAKTADKQASQLLDHPGVRVAILAIEKCVTQAGAAVRLVAEVVDTEWLKLALSSMIQESPAALIQWDEKTGAPTGLDLSKLEDMPGLSMRIDGIKITTSKDWPTEKNVELKLSPIAGLLKLFGDLTDIGAFTERLEVTDRTELAQKIRDARKRALKLVPASAA